MEQMIQRELRKDLENLKYKLIPKNELEKELKVLVEAVELQKFYLEKAKSQMDSSNKSKTTILWNEKIIKNIEEEIIIYFKNENSKSMLKRFERN